MIEDKGWTVYMHTAPNGKKYVGITSQKPKHRWNNGNGYIENKHFFSAIKKYGWDNFEHKILCSGLNVAQAGCIEQTFIRGLDLRNPANGYNNSKGGEYGALGIHHSVETRRKISEGNKGKHPSAETRQKISESLKDNIPWNKGKHLSQEERRKVSELLKGKTTKAVICIETGTLYSSVTEAAKSIGIAKSNITAVCRHKRERAGGYHWKYVEM